MIIKKFSLSVHHPIYQICLFVLQPEMVIHINTYKMAYLGINNIVMHSSSVAYLALLLAKIAVASDKACSPAADYCRNTPIASWNFDNSCPVFNGPGTNWFYFGAGPFIANDGVLVCGKTGGSITSNPFTISVPNSPTPALDHPKYLAFDATPKNVPAGGKLFLEWDMSVETFNTENSPFPEQVLQGINDVRLALGGAVAIDFVNSLVFSFFLTNDRVYAVYERLPFSREALGNYFSYVYFVPVAKRKPCQFHRLQLVLDDEKKSVRYIVDKKLGLVANKVGFPLTDSTPSFDLGGTPALAFPTSVNIGLGTFTILDFYPASTDIKGENPCGYPAIREALVNAGDASAPPSFNPVLGAPNLASYWDPIGTNIQNHIFGQGAAIQIKKMTASIKDCNSN